MLKIQLESLFFEDRLDNVEEVLELLHKLLGELQFFFIKKHIVPAAKRIGADLFEFATPEIEEVVSGRKKLKKNCKRCWNKNSSETIGRWKKEIQTSNW